MAKGGIKTGLATPSQPDMDKSWEHEDHARTLMKAGEIMTDPDKMAGAMKHVKKQKKAFKSLNQLKQFAQQKYGGKGNPDMQGPEDMDDGGGI